MSARAEATDVADRSIPVEIEAKLLVPREADLRAIGRLTHLEQYPLRARGAVRLRSIYLDTPSLTLARDRVSLRLRRQGRQWEATVKWAGRVDNEMHERPELTIALAKAPALPFLPPPGPLATQLAALVAGRPLRPILITDIHRRLFDVLPPDPTATQAPVAELALDRVRLRAPEEGHPETAYLEVEVECRHGKRRDVTRLARMLRAGFNLVPSHESKFARGLALLYGGGIAGSADQHVLAYDTVQQAARRILARQLHSLRVHDPGTRTGEDPEALHDLRVATRRLRAAVRIFAKGMPARLQATMSRELHWLGQLLGNVRDLDVQLEKLDRFTAAAPAGFRPALGSLRDYLDGERVRRRAAMLAGLGTARYFRLLLQLEHFSQRRPSRSAAAAVQEPISIAGHRAIKKAFRRLLKRGEKIAAMPHPEDLHALRIRAKRLRYLLEFLQELIGKPGARVVKRLTLLQDLLGSYHDAVVAAEVVRVYLEGAGKELPPAQLVALGALVASELRLVEEKRDDFDATWRRFARPRTARDCRAILRKLGGFQAPPADERPPLAAAPQDPKSDPKSDPKTTLREE